MKVNKDSCNEATSSGCLCVLHEGHNGECWSGFSVRDILEGWEGLSDD